MHPSIVVRYSATAIMLAIGCASLSNGGMKMKER